MFVSVYVMIERAREQPIGVSIRISALLSTRLQRHGPCLERGVFTNGREHVKSATPARAIDPSLTVAYHVFEGYRCPYVLSMPFTVCLTVEA